MIKLTQILKEIQVTGGVSAEQVWELGLQISKLHSLKKDSYRRKWRKAVRIFEKWGYNNNMVGNMNIPEWLKTLSPQIRQNIYKELKDLLNL